MMKDYRREQSIPALLPPILLVICVGLERVFPGFSGELREVPFLLSLFVLGMPHGATDLARIWETYGRKGTIPQFSLYLLIIGLSVGALFLFPLASLAGFALVSVWHFGRSDYWEHGPRFRILRSLCRGVFIVVLPVVASPASVYDVCSGWVVLLSSEIELIALQENWAGVVAALQFLVYAAVLSWIAMVIFLVADRSAGITREITETAVLCLSFATLDPLFAVGTWFVVWHSLRHLEFDSETSGNFHIWIERITGIGLRSLPLLVPTVIVYSVLCWISIGQWNPALFVSLLLIFFAAVTPAHEWLDLRLHRHS